VETNPWAEAHHILQGRVAYHLGHGLGQVGGYDPLEDVFVA
jgi:hypothetical protein